MIKRRAFITLLGSAAATWPIAARGQQPGMPVIGLLGLGSPEGEAGFVAEFRKGLGDAGYVADRNVTIAFRWAQNDNARLAGLAADLVRRRVDVIVVLAGTSAVLAAKAATTTIPIVFHTGADPVRSGIVTSLNRPTGNITGVFGLAPQVVSKRLGLLHEIAPGRGPIAVLSNPGDDFTGKTDIPELQAAAATLSRTIEVFNATNNREIDAAFENIVKAKAEALLVTPNNLFNNRSSQIAILAARHGIPAITSARAFPVAGGLMSYSGSAADQYRQVALYTARILKGEKPADLPVMQASKFELVINMQTARSLGIMVPPSLLATADEVIE
jgi:putative ABC transport system substrate-binding protein